MPLLIKAVVCAVVFASAASAQTGWVPLDAPPGSPVYWNAGTGGYLLGADGFREQFERLYRTPDNARTVEVIPNPSVPPGYRLNGFWATGGVFALWFQDGVSFRDGLLYFSRDLGLTWSVGALLPDTEPIDFAVLGDTLVFAADSEGPRPGVGFGPLRVVWSADGGASWMSQPLDSNPLPGAESQFSRSLFVDRGAVHAATTRGLYRATRGAENWVRVTDGALGVGGGRLNLWDSAVTDDGTAYTTTSGGCGAFLPGLYRRLPGEVVWARIDVEDELDVPDAACYPFLGLAAVGDTVVTLLTLPTGFPLPGVPISGNRGETWQYAGEGLPTASSGGVAPGSVFEANGDVYAYADDGPNIRLYRLRRSAEVAAEPTPALGSFKTWPNPARDVLRIEADGPAVVRVLDVTGRVVVGWSQADARGRIDVSKLPAGIYTLDARVSSRTVNHRFTVLR